MPTRGQASPTPALVWALEAMTGGVETEIQDPFCPILSENNGEVKALGEKILLGHNLPLTVEVPVSLSCP